MGGVLGCTFRIGGSLARYLHSARAFRGSYDRYPDIAAYATFPLRAYILSRSNLEGHRSCTRPVCSLPAALGLGRFCVIERLLRLRLANVRVEYNAESPCKTYDGRRRCCGTWPKRGIIKRD